MPADESGNVFRAITGTDYQQPLVLFLPGLSGNVAQWDAVVPRLKDLAANLAYGPPILPHPAYGNSRPTVLGAASAICAQLRRDGRRDVLIVAHSVGTFVALSVARLAPDVVRSVIVVNGGLVQVAKFLDRPVRAMIATPRTCLNSLRLFVLVGAPAPSSVKRAIASSERSSKVLLGGLVSDAALESAEQRNSLIAEAGSPATVRALWNNRHHWREFESYAHQISTKVLFLVGDQDPISSEIDSRAMAAMLPNSEITMLKGVGHAAPLETASAVADTIADQYLATQEPTEASMLQE